MQSAVIVMYFLPKLFSKRLKSLIVVANCRGVAAKKSSMSKSTPSREYVLTALARVETKVCLLDSEENAWVQLLFGPPTDSKILLPVFLQLFV